MSMIAAVALASASFMVARPSGSERPRVPTARLLLSRPPQSRRRRNHYVLFQ
jgi:hypothetical protein